jgi:hypothetical protein
MKLAEAEGLRENMPPEVLLFVVVQPLTATATKSEETIMAFARNIILSNQQKRTNQRRQMHMCSCRL